MPLYTLGSIPGSQLHLAANVALEPLQTALNDARGLAALATASVEAMLEVPDLDALSAQLDVSAFADVDYGGLALTGAANITAEIDAIAQLSLELGEILGVLTAALGGGGIAAYRYSGDASGLGPTLGTQTDTGLPGGDSDDTINALIVASADPVAWASLAALLGPAGGFSTNAATRSIEVLGEIPGPGLHIGLVGCVPALNQLITDLATKTAALVALTIQFAGEVGLSAPIDPFSLSAGASVQLTGLATLQSDLATFGLQTSLAVNIEGALYLGLVALLEPIVATLEAGLSGPGVELYRYSGPASLLATGLEQATRGGLAGSGPNDAITAIALATGSPSDWASLEAALYTG